MNVIGKIVFGISFTEWSPRNMKLPAGVSTGAFHTFCHFESSQVKATSQPLCDYCEILVICKNIRRNHAILYCLQRIA